MQVWNVLQCPRLAENTGCKNYTKNRHLRTIAQLCQGTSLQLRHVSTIGKNLLNDNTSSICLNNMVNFGPLTAEICWQVLGHPHKFQRVSWIGFVTALTLLNGGQPNFARCLAISCAGILYIHFWGLLPLTEFCQLQNSLCFQVLHSAILAVLLHGTRAVGVSQSLWRCTRNAELSQRRHIYIRQGGHHVGHRPTF